MANLCKVSLLSAVLLVLCLAVNGQDDPLSAASNVTDAPVDPTPIPSSNSTDTSDALVPDTPTDTTTTGSAPGAAVNEGPAPSGGNETVVSEANAQDASKEKHMCYKCNSHPDHDGAICDDPINEEELKKQNKVAECNGICLKYYQDIENDFVQITRDCAENLEEAIKEKEKDEGCVLSTGTKLIKTQICNCVGSFCNGVSETKSATSLIVAAGFVALVASLLY